MIEIKKIENKSELKKFIDFPHELYKNDKNYVPELFISQKELLSKTKNPYYEHSDAILYLAFKDGKVVGRIAAIKNNNYVAFTGKKTSFFGFFETIEDYNVAQSLLDKVVSWSKEEGYESIMGPANYSTNETVGLLIEGFDMPPVVMTTYNKPYYVNYIERYNFTKAMDLLSYKIPSEKPSEKLVRYASIIEKRLKDHDIVIRKVDFKNFDQEIIKLRQIYNSAWEKNWGFVPMTDKEFEHVGQDLKLIADPDFVLIAEKNGVPIGFSAIIPDVNQVFKKIKRGRLLPFGIFKLLYYKNKVDVVRVLTLGVIEKYRKLGIDAYIYAKGFEQAKKKNIKWAEASWILENNILMNRAILNVNGKVYKKHRVYTLSLNGKV